jgi:hypothetical protein
MVMRLPLARASVQLGWECTSGDVGGVDSLKGAGISFEKSVVVDDTVVRELRVLD